jgi:hypothetical protein
VDQLGPLRQMFKVAHVENGEFRNDSTDFLIESVLGELDLSHVDCWLALYPLRGVRKAHNS